MTSLDSRNLRSIRRLNRRIHDPINTWLGSALASLVRLKRGDARPPAGLPERQDLYGFSFGDSGDSREPQPCRGPRGDLDA